MTKAHVYKLTCPRCTITSYIGFEGIPDSKGLTFGLHGFMSDSKLGWIHCPVCDESLQGGEDDPLSDHVSEVTQGGEA